MAVTYGFYDSIGNDRTYNAEQMSRIFEGILTDGIFQSIGGNLVVSANSGMNINVATGRAWFFNTWTNNDSVLGLTVAASHASLHRIDRVILEINKEVGVRANTIKMLAGTPSSTPVAPSLTNTATIKQYALADIYVGAGVTSIVVGNITNKVGSTGTPFITGILASADIGTLMGQYESQFDDWFDNLVDQLSGVQVTNLQAQIDDLALRTTKGWIEVSDSWTYLSASTVTVPTDATTKYKKGFGVRFKQGGAYKYMYIMKLTTTVLTLLGGSDFSVANAAITDVAFCPDPKTAFGFPVYHNYIPVLTAATTNPVLGNGTLTGTFIVSGGQIDFTIDMKAGSTTTYGTGLWSISAPYIPDLFTLEANFLGQLRLTDWGTGYKIGAVVFNLGKFRGTGEWGDVTHNNPFTWAVDDVLIYSGTYKY